MKIWAGKRPVAEMPGIPRRGEEGNGDGTSSAAKSGALDPPADAGAGSVGPGSASGFYFCGPVADRQVIRRRGEEGNGDGTSSAAKSGALDPPADAGAGSLDPGSASVFSVCGSVGAASSPSPVPDASPVTGDAPRTARPVRVSALTVRASPGAPVTVPTGPAAGTGPVPEARTTRSSRPSPSTSSKAATASGRAFVMGRPFTLTVSRTIARGSTSTLPSRATVVPRAGRQPVGAGTSLARIATATFRGGSFSSAAGPRGGPSAWVAASARSA